MLQFCNIFVIISKGACGVDPSQLNMSNCFQNELYNMVILLQETMTSCVKQRITHMKSYIEVLESKSASAFESVKQFSSSGASSIGSGSAKSKNERRSCEPKDRKQRRSSLAQLQTDELTEEDTSDLGTTIQALEDSVSSFYSKIVRDDEAGIDYQSLITTEGSGDTKKLFLACEDEALELTEEELRELGRFAETRRTAGRFTEDNTMSLEELQDSIDRLLLEEGCSSDSCSSGTTDNESDESDGLKDLASDGDRGTAQSCSTPSGYGTSDDVFNV